MSAGKITAIYKGEQITLDESEQVTFHLGDGDKRVSASIRHGYLNVHSHSWDKNLAAVGDASNVLRLIQVER